MIHNAAITVNLKRLLAVEDSRLKNIQCPLCHTEEKFQMSIDAYIVVSYKRTNRNEQARCCKHAKAKQRKTNTYIMDAVFSVFRRAKRDRFHGRTVDGGDVGRPVQVHGGARLRAAHHRRVAVD